LVGSKFEKGYRALAEACLRARALLYCNNTPGDAGTTSAGISQNVAGYAANIAISGAQIGEAAAQVAITSTLGLATAGIGLAIGPILAIFQNHAKAVTAQANALSTLCPQASVAIQKFDNAVFTGQATPAQAQLATQQLAASMAASVKSLTKNCNAFCAYNAILQAFVAIAPAYYQQGLNPPNLAQLNPMLAPGSPANTGQVASILNTTAGPSEITQAIQSAATGLFSPATGSYFQIGSFHVPTWAFLLLGAFILFRVFAGRGHVAG
jgi:hypothetical protein